MTTTIILFACMVVALIGTTVVLVMRDLNAAAAAEAEAALIDHGPAVVLLPTPISETRVHSFTGRIDQTFRRLIYQSGIDISAEPAFLLMVLSGLLLGGPIFIWRDDPVVGSIGMVAGMAIPLTYFIIKRGQRLRKLREQLPDAMELMSRAVRAGETLDQSIESVGLSADAPIGLEFKRCARQLELGLSMPAAMRSLTFRAPITEMRILAATFNVQRRTGGNLGITLDRLARVIRDRLSYHRQFQAATGATRIATIMISLAGPAVFTYMMIWQPDYMGNFFNLPGGAFLLGTAVVLQAVGLTWVVGLLKNDY
jgi:tight adherence protein B